MEVVSISKVPGGGRTLLTATERKASISKLSEAAARAAEWRDSYGYSAHRSADPRPQAYTFWSSHDWLSDDERLAILGPRR